MPLVAERVDAQGRERRATAGLIKDEGDASVYLASDEARWVTGQVLTVDAGVMISRLPGGYYDREPEFVAGLATEAD